MQRHGIFFPRACPYCVYARGGTKNVQRTYTIAVRTHIHLPANTNCADAPFYCDIWVHMQIILLWQFKKENSWLKIEAMGRRHMQRMLIEVANYTKGSAVFLLHYILIYATGWDQLVRYKSSVKTDLLFSAIWWMDFCFCFPSGAGYLWGKVCHINTNICTNSFCHL